MANEPREVIVEKSSSNGAMTALIAILVIALLAFGAFALIQSENRKDNAVTAAAQSVGDAADSVGDAVEDTAKK